MGSVSRPPAWRSACVACRPHHIGVEVRRPSPGIGCILGLLVMTARSPAAPNDRTPGATVSRYQLLERIGEGGMGVVWRSFDLELEEEVAIKFLREDFGRDEKLRALFRREVKLARRVTHPNVARVFELGREGDLYFLTMEYIAGESLHEQLAWLGPMPARRVPGFAVSLCRGLAAAHAAGWSTGTSSRATSCWTRCAGRCSRTSASPGRCPRRRATSRTRRGRRCTCRPSGSPATSSRWPATCTRSGWCCSRRSPGRRRGRRSSSTS
jgi:hypothetical protein